MHGTKLGPASGLPCSTVTNLCRPNPAGRACDTEPATAAAGIHSDGRRRRWRRSSLGPQQPPMQLTRLLLQAVPPHRPPATALRSVSERWAFGSGGNTKW